MIANLMRKIRGKPPRPFEYLPGGWSQAARSEKVRGWDVESVFAAQLGRWEQVKQSQRAPRAIGVADENVIHTANDVIHHNTAITFAYVALLAARDKQRLSMLDWGGGLCEYSLLAREVLPGEIEIDYHCKEVPSQLPIARRTAPDAVLYSSDEEFAGRRFDLVMASGALQYVEDWRGTLKRLIAATGGYLYVTRLPVVLDQPSFVVVQRPYAYGYDTEYPFWCLAREEFLEAAQDGGVELAREFVVGETFDMKGAPAPFHARGYLFRPASRNTT